MLFLWGFNFFSKLASIRLFRLHDFFSLFFLCSSCFTRPFSNGPSIAVKLLMANLLVLVITYCVNVTNMYI